MHYGHSIKYWYYLDGIFIIQSWEGAIFFSKCINISDVNIEKIFEILGIQLSVDIILMVYSLYRARKERYSIVFNYI
jgi:hypothetical protein